MDFASGTGPGCRAQGFAVVAENGSVRVSGGDDYGAMMGVAKSSVRATASTAWPLLHRRC